MRVGFSVYSRDFVFGVHFCPRIILPFESRNCSVTTPSRQYVIPFHSAAFMLFHHIRVMDIDQLCDPAAVIEIPLVDPVFLHRFICLRQSFSERISTTIYAPSLIFWTKASFSLIECSLFLCSPQNLNCSVCFSVRDSRRISLQ